jgi:hypothetical protein
LRIATGNVGRIDLDHGSSLPFARVSVMEYSLHIPLPCSFSRS